MKNKKLGIWKRRKKIDDRQFGFRKQKSTIDAIAKITKVLVEFRRKEKTAVSLLILRKPMIKSTEIKHFNN